MASTPRPPEDSSISTAMAAGHSSTWATDKDWTKYRALIGELYSSHTLTEVMRLMGNEHRFKATSVVHPSVSACGLAD